MPFLAISIFAFSIKAQTPGEQVDKLFDEWNNIQTPGAAVAVVQNGKIVFSKGYGSANLEYDIPITPSTVFHIASDSKQFTAFAVLLLEADGKLSMEDDVRKYIPELPDYGHKITLNNLAWHTSGIRDQWTLLTLAGWRLDDVITQKQILKLVCMQKNLDFMPGEEHVYSNSGYTLLAEVVARVSGKTFAEFTSERIFKPLGMTNTFFNENQESVCKNRAYSYYPDGKNFKKSLLNYGTYGATSLLTTVEDLSKWVSNFENPVVGSKQIIEKMNTCGALNNGKAITYAMGQDILKYKGLTYICHGGADAGYRAYICRFPDQHFSVIVLSNNGYFDPAGMAEKITDIYLKDQFTSEISDDAIPILVSEKEYRGDEKILSAYCGDYLLRPGYTFQIVTENSKLYATNPEIGKQLLTRTSVADFSLPAMNATLTFIPDNNGRFNSINVVLNGQKITATRVVNFDPSQINLDEYAGDYYSPELNTTYTLTVHNKQLVVSHPREEDFTLDIVKKDVLSTWEWFFNKVEFTRDDKSAIIGLNVSSSRINNMRFDKVK